MAQDLHLDAWTLVPWAVERFGCQLATVDRGASVDPSEALLLTYAQLGGRSASLARHMMAAWGIRRGSRIGVMKRNSTSVIEVHFAAAALHAIVVNVNISLAPRELAHVLRDSGCEVLIADSEFAATVSAAIVATEEPLDQPPPDSQSATSANPKTACLMRLVVWDGRLASSTGPPVSSAYDPLAAWLNQVHYKGGY